MIEFLTGKKNVLITGGAGFIGSALAEELLKVANVIVIDSFISGSESNIDHLLSYPNFIFLKHDLSIPINLIEQPELARFKVKYQGIQEIYHLACPTSPKDFMKYRVETARANALATVNALDIAVANKSKILFFSSAVIYGPRQEREERVQEDDIGLVDNLSPRACYDEGKRFAESLVWTYKDVHKIDTKIIRPFRTYGPRLKLFDGHMVSDFVDSALDNKDVVIYGDTTFSSSLTYISDVINASLAVMKSELSGPYNVGNDTQVTLTEVAEMVIRLTGSKSKIVYKEPLEFMSPLPLPNIQRIKDDLGWFPIVRLEDGLKKTIDYLQAHKGLLGISSQRTHDESEKDTSDFTSV
jgi:UDP-glucuronate decarboxylase